MHKYFPEGNTPIPYDQIAKWFPQILLKIENNTVHGYAEIWKLFQGYLMS